MVLTNLWHAIETKLPLLALIVLVWWFIRQEPEDTASDDDGGQLTKPGHDRHPHRPGPRPRGPHAPRRGPHGDPPVPSPRRVRRVQARARVRQRH